VENDLGSLLRLPFEGLYSPHIVIAIAIEIEINTTKILKINLTRT